MYFGDVIITQQCMTGTYVAITYEFHYVYNYNRWIEILALLTKIKLHLNFKILGLRYDRHIVNSHEDTLE